MLMKSKIKNIIPGITIFSIIFIVQVIIFVYWSNAKHNFFVDEFYSMGYANSFTGRGDIGQYVTASKDWKFNEWINNSNLKKYLIVSGEESVLDLPFISVLKLFFTGRNYFGILNIFESFFGNNHISQTPSLILNIIILLLSELTIFRFLKKLGCDKRTAYISISLFGFSEYIITKVEYVRFYMLIILFGLLIISLFYEIWMCSDIKKFIFSGFLLMILSYLSFKNSEVTVVFLVSLGICVFTGLTLTRQWAKAITVLGAAVLGGLFVFFKFEYYNLLISYFQKKNVIQHGLTDRLMLIQNFTISEFKWNLSQITEVIKTYFFSNMSILLSCLGITSLITLIASDDANDGLFTPKFINKKTIKTFLSNHRGRSIKLRPITSLLLLFWSILTIKYKLSSNTGKFCLFILTLTIIYIYLDSIGKRPSIAVTNIGKNGQFILIIIGSALIYTLLSALCHLTKPRYYCFGYLMISVILWFLADRLIKYVVPQKAHKSIYCVIAVFTVIMAYMPFETRNIDYMYEQDKAMMRDIQQYSSLDVILISSINQDTNEPARHDTYDCINIMSDQSRIYAFDLLCYDYENIPYPKTDFVLWSSIERDISKAIEDLQNHDYSVELIGTTHISQAYICHFNNN